MKILLAPDKAILEAKKKRDLTKSLIILLISSLLFLATVVVYYWSTDKLENLLKPEFPVGVYAFIIPFVGSLFLGFVLVIAVNTLGGNGVYFDGLTTLSYSLLPLSIGIFLSITINSLLGALKITDLNINMIIGLISFAIGTFFSAESVAIIYRAIKEFFETDMITAFIGATVLSAAIVIPLYVMIYLPIILTLIDLIGSLGSILPTLL